MNYAVKKYLGKTSIYAVVIIIWLAVWQIVASIYNLELLFPSPLSTIRALGGLIVGKNFWISSLMTLSRIAIGFVLGVIFGTILAFLTHFVQPLNYFFRPMLVVIRATPVASFILLAILWFSSDRTPVFIAFLMVIPIVWENISSGLRNVDKNLIELTKVYNFTLKKKIRFLYFPSVIPYFAAGCTTSLGLAWKAGVAAEVLCVTKSSIGIGLYHSKIYLETPQLFAWTLSVVAMSLALEKIIVLSICAIKKSQAKKTSNGKESS